MGNPLLLLSTRDRVRRQILRRRQVAVPSDVPGTDAIFLVEAVPTQPYAIAPAKKLRWRGKKKARKDPGLLLVETTDALARCRCAVDAGA